MKIETLPPISPIKASEIQSLDPVQIIVQERCQGEAHVIVECFGKCWAAYFRFGAGTVWEFLASLGRDYLSQKLARHEEIRKRGELQYLERVSQAVIDAAKLHLTTQHPKTETERMVTVCSSCLKASCWQGLHMCDESTSAGTVDKLVSELAKLNLENPSYWEAPQ